MSNDVSKEKRREYMREYMQRWRSDPHNRRKQRVYNRKSYFNSTRKKLQERGKKDAADTAEEANVSE